MKHVRGWLVSPSSCQLQTLEGVLKPWAWLSPKRWARSTGFRRCLARGIPRSTSSRLNGLFGGGSLGPEPTTDRPTLLSVESFKTREEPILVEHPILLHPSSVTIALVGADGLSSLFQAVKQHSSHLAHLTDASSVRFGHKTKRLVRFDTSTQD